MATSKSKDYQALARRIKDTRAPAIVEAHSALALAALEQENARILKVIKAHKELSHLRNSEILSGGNKTSYYSKFSWWSLLIVDVKLYFYNSDNHSFEEGRFEGLGGGLAIGGGGSWGTSWLNFSVGSLRGLKGIYEANLSATVTNINIWKKDGGELIGNFVGGGAGAGAGIVGGEGTFK